MIIKQNRSILISSHNSQGGFSLLELLIVGVLLVIIFISVSSLMMSSLTSSLRTSLWQELRTEGTYAMNQMAFLIRNSPQILADTNCNNTATSAVFFDNADDTKSALVVDTDYSGLNTLSLIIINDDQAFLTPLPAGATTIPLLSSSVLLNENNIFTCSKAGEQAYIQIAFTLTKESAVLNDIAQQFRRTVILRNQ